MNQNQYFVVGNFIYFGQAGKTALAALERHPSSDPMGRGAPRYTPAQRRRISATKAVLLDKVTPLLARKMAAARQQVLDVAAQAPAQAVAS